MAKSPAQRVSVEEVPWPELAELFRRQHRLGQHVSCVGPTGSGKSTAVIGLLEERGRRQATDGRPVRITVLADKGHDATLAALRWPVLRSVKEWPPGYGQEQVIVQPPEGTPSRASSRQRETFRFVLDEAYVSRNQIVYIDEAAYFSEPWPQGLGFASVLQRFWTASRSRGVSIFAATQRPRRVPLPMWTEPYWVLIFRPEDEEDVKRVAQQSGSKQAVLEIVPQLGTHEFLLVQRRPVRRLIVSQVSK